MNDNRTLEQITAIFSLLMVIFYLGIGVYLVFFFNLGNLDKPIRVIVGSSFILYGLYRAFRTYFKIVELFFTKNKDED